MAQPINWDELSKSVLAGGAGAVDEFLFGLPEFVAKKIDRKKVEDWIKANAPAYKTGEAIGTVGSMFVPYAGLAGKAAKGLGLGAKVAKGAATAAKTADVATDLTRGAKLAKTLKAVGTMAGKGAAAGATEAGVRGITSEKSLKDIAKDIKSGAIWGGAGGAVGGALAKTLPRRAGEMTKKAEQSYLGSTDLTRREALQMLKDMSGPGAKGMAKLKTADRARKELVRVGKEIGAHIPGKMDDAILAHKATWQMLDDVVEKAMPNVKGSDIYRAAASKIDMDDLAKQFGAENVNEAMERILKGGETRTGLANVRGYLQDVIDNTFRQGTITKGIDAGAQRLDRTIVQRLRTNLDDIVVDTAQKAGMNIDFAKLKRDYLPMRAIADAAAKADIAPFRAGGGSTTMEKLGTSLALAGLGGATGYGAGEGDTQERLKRAAITAALTGAAGVGGQALSRAAGGAATRGLASILPVASKAEKALTKIAPEVLETYGARTGGKIAAEISRAAKQEAAPATPKEEEAADTGAAAGAGDQPAYINQVMDKMRSYAAIRGVSEDSEEFAQFAREVYVATEGFAPDKIGGILYPNPDERKAYLKALSAARRMSEVMPTATAERPGLLQREPEETEMARTAAVDQLAAIVGDVAKERGSEAAAKKALQKILGGRESPERKAELVRVLLAQYGVDIDALAEMGVV